MTKGNYTFQKPISVIGTERLSAGLYRIWYKGADVGIMSWVPGETHSRRWVCDAGVYLTQREALAAMEKLLCIQ